MGMDVEAFATAALALDGAVEKSHMGHADFRVKAGIFASIPDPDAQIGMVRLDPDDQDEFVRRHPGMFVPAAGTWGKMGCTYVHLRSAPTAAVKRALRLAWQARTAEPVAKRRASAAAKKKAPARSRGPG